MRCFSKSRDLITTIFALDIHHYIGKFYAIEIISDNTYNTITYTDDIGIRAYLVYYSVISSFAHSDVNTCAGITRYLFDCMETGNAGHVVPLLKQRIHEEGGVATEFWD